MYILICKFVTNHKNLFINKYTPGHMMAEQPPQRPIFLCPRCEEKGELVTEVTDGHSFPEQKERVEVTREGRADGRGDLPAGGISHVWTMYLPYPPQKRKALLPRTFLLGVPARLDLGGSQVDQETLSGSLYPYLSASLSLPPHFQICTHLALDRVHQQAEDEPGFSG